MQDVSEVPVPEADAAAAMPKAQFVSFPGSPFELFQPYPPAGDQPEAIDQAGRGRAATARCSRPCWA